MTVSARLICKRLHAVYWFSPFAYLLFTNSGRWPALKKFLSSPLDTSLPGFYICDQKNNPKKTNEKVIIRIRRYPFFILLLRQSRKIIVPAIRIATQR